MSWVDAAVVCFQLMDIPQTIRTVSSRVKTVRLVSL